VAKYHPVGRFDVPAAYLPAQHRHLTAADQEFDIYGSTVAGNTPGPPPLAHLNVPVTR
jgi:hypothetical protein